jgi:hypothetical protein
MTLDPWLLGALALAAAGYAVYLVGLARDLVEPNRTSWLIWSAATGVEAGTYAAVNPAAPQAAVFALSTVACVIVSAAMWRRSRWRAPAPTEVACLVASAAAIALWLLFRETFWAHMLVVAAVPVSFWPTWASVREDPGRERSPAWGLWTLGDLVTLAIALRQPAIGVGETAYVVVELACHLFVLLMVGLSSLDPRLLLRRPARAGSHPPSPALFTVRETELGKSVFAGQPFATGDVLVRFSGRRIGAARVRRPMTGADDRYVQVAPDEYMGPSGRIDDLVNHSCDPNAGLRFLTQGVFLVALRPIAVGEEIAWDYSTTVDEPDWRMACRCGAPTCRGVVTRFAQLPPERQSWFRDRDLVAPHLREPARAE